MKTNHIYHGTRNLISLPGRSVTTFPSGLIRIDKSYACRLNLAARYRTFFEVGQPLPDDDGAPSIDGAFIYPDAQETRREDGFVEFRVSAYGRTVEAYRNIRLREIKLARGSSIFSLFNFTAEFVAPGFSSVNLPDIELVAGLLDPQSITVQPGRDLEVLNFALTNVSEGFRGRKRRTYQINYSVLGGSETVRTESIPFDDPIPAIIDQRNFGSFTEYQVDFIR
jgi:hypothetical protein